MASRKKKKIQPKRVKHKNIYSGTCKGLLVHLPNNPSNYLLCKKCGQVISKEVVEHFKYIDWQITGDVYFG